MNRGFAHARQRYKKRGSIFGTSPYLPKQEELAMTVILALACVVLVSLGMTSIGTWLALDEQV